MTIHGKPPVAVRKLEDGRVELTNFSWRVFHVGRSSGKLYAVSQRAWTEPNIVSAGEWQRLRRAASDNDESVAFARGSFIQVAIDFGLAKAPWLIEKSEWQELRALFL